jgi:hypothetical protein
VGLVNQAQGLRRNLHLEPVKYVAATLVQREVSLALQDFL